MWRLCESDLEVRPGQAVKKPPQQGGGGGFSINQYWALSI